MCLSKASCFGWSPGICCRLISWHLLELLHQKVAAISVCSVFCDDWNAVSVHSSSPPGLSSVWNIRAAFLTAMHKEGQNLHHHCKYCCVYCTSSAPARFSLSLCVPPSFVPVGIIRTALPNMDREAKEEYHVVIQAKDMGGHMGGLSGTTKVTITLTDVNDNPPKFPQSEYQQNPSHTSYQDPCLWSIRHTHSLSRQ